MAGKIPRFYHSGPFFHHSRAATRKKSVNVQQGKAHFSGTSLERNFAVEAFLCSATVDNIKRIIFQDPNINERAVPARF